MSKLIDRLGKLAEGSAQPLGFGAAASRQKALPMLIVARIPPGDPGLASEVVAAGAYSVMAPVADWKKEKQAVSDTVAEAKLESWGVLAQAPTVDCIRELQDMKCDFTVFEAENAPASLLNEGDSALVMQLSPPLDDMLARAAGRLGIDAVLIAPDKDGAYPLSVRALMDYDRLVAAVGKHVLATVPPDMPLDNLGALWLLGVRGLVVEAPPKKMADRTSELRGALEQLPLKRRKAGNKYSATLPGAPGTTSETVPDEEEDDDY